MKEINNIPQQLEQAGNSNTGFSELENPASSPPLAEWTPGTISEVAYRLYEERGRVDGHALDDWLEAETIVRLYHKLAA
jgi:hypothetical protein